MSNVLHYAAAPAVTRARARWAAVACAVVFSAAGGATAVACAAGGLNVYFGTFGGCATGRIESLFQMRVLGGCACVFPLTGWLIARHLGSGVLPCRAALCAGLTAWLGANVISLIWP